MSGLVFAIPSKGRLKEQAEHFLADCGLAVKADPRGYAATMPALPDVAVRLLSSGEIAAALREGRVHAGIVGEDLLRETEPSLANAAPLLPLGFGRADLVVAAPKSWIDVASMADLDEVCHAYRARTGARLRVATKYTALTRAFFDAHGLDDYRIVESLGATEGAPRAGAAEIIVDITTTGATLEANHLKVLKDGLILKSQAQLAASRAIAWNAPALAMLSSLVDAIEARTHARATRILSVVCEAGAEKAVIAAAERTGCEPGEGKTTGALVFLCPDAQIVRAGSALLEAGAKTVTAAAPNFLFRRRSNTLRRFLDSLTNKP